MAKNLHDEKDIQSSFDWHILKRLYKYLKPHLPIFIICLLLITGTTFVDLSIPYLIKTAIDDSITVSNDPMVITDDTTINESIEFQNQFYEKISFDDINQGHETIYQLIKFDKQYYLVTGIDKPIDNTTVSISNQTLVINQMAYDYTLLTKDEATIFKAKEKAKLFKIGWTMIALLLASFAMGFINIYLLHFASQKIVYTIRQDLFDHLQNLPLSFFDKNPVGRLVTRVTNDMKNISQMFTDVLVTSIKDFFLIFGTVIVMVSINGKLALLTLATLPVVLFSAYMFRIKARNVQRDVKVKLAKINATLAENLSGMKIIQIFSREKEVFEEFEQINADHLQSSVAETKVYAVFRPSMNLIYSISLSLLLWFGGGEAIRNVIELGVLIAFIQYIQQFFRPIFDLTEKFNIFQSAMASSERVFMLLDEKSDIIDPEEPLVLSDECFEGKIQFEDVHFSYSGKMDETVLKGISFTAEPGETIALVGATGSGKTTIISLLNRFYDIQQGSIKIDGTDIRHLRKKDLRDKISIVLQDVFLFAGDIKSNIRLNNKNITDEQVIDSSKYVNAHRFICKLPNQYDEEVKERGATLSTGQRQLISFARALAFDPKILILDEATSSIDTETELLIQDAIDKLIKGRTTIIVAHRLSTIKNADKIIVMNKGEIMEIGSHDDLLKQGGMYYDLYKLQYQ